MKMTKGQIQKLKLLGYEATQEDGALLRHRRLVGLDSYVWKDDVFDDVLSKFAARFESGLRKRISYEIVRA